MPRQKKQAPDPLKTADSKCKMPSYLLRMIFAAANHLYLALNAPRTALSAQTWIFISQTRNAP